jgi:hypothetical protein
MPTDFSSVSELIQERDKVMGKQPDAYNLPSISKIYVPSVFDDSANGLTCDRMPSFAGWFAGLKTIFSSK